MIESVANTSTENALVNQNGTHPGKKRHLDDIEVHTRIKCFRKNDPYKISTCVRSPTPPFIKKIENELKNEETVLSILLNLQDRQNCMKYNSDKDLTEKSAQTVIIQDSITNGHSDTKTDDDSKINNSSRSTYSIDNMLSEGKIQTSDNNANGLNPTLSEYLELQSQEQSLIQKRLTLRKQRDKSLLSIPDLNIKMDYQDIFVPTVASNEFLLSFGLENVFENIFSYQLKSDMLPVSDIEQIPSVKSCVVCFIDFSTSWKQFLQSSCKSFLYKIPNLNINTDSLKDAFVCENCNRNAKIAESSQIILEKLNQVLDSFNEQDRSLESDLQKVTTEISNILNDPIKSKLVKQSKPNNMMCQSDMDLSSLFFQFLGSNSHNMGSNTLAQHQQEAMLLAMLASFIPGLSNSSNNDQPSLFMNANVHQKTKSRPGSIAKSNEEEIMNFLSTMYGQSTFNDNNEMNKMNQEQLALMFATNPQMALYLMSSPNHSTKNIPSNNVANGLFKFPSTKSTENTSKFSNEAFKKIQPADTPMSSKILNEIPKKNLSQEELALLEFQRLLQPQLNILAPHSISKAPTNSNSGRSTSPTSGSSSPLKNSTKNSGIPATSNHNKTTSFSSNKRPQQTEPSPEQQWAQMQMLLKMATMSQPPTSLSAANSSDTQIAVLNSLLAAASYSPSQQQDQQMQNLINQYLLAGMASSTFEGQRNGVAHKESSTKTLEQLVMPPPPPSATPPSKSPAWRKSPSPAPRPSTSLSKNPAVSKPQQSSPLLNSSPKSKVNSNLSPEEVGSLQQQMFLANYLMMMQQPQQNSTNASQQQQHQMLEYLARMMAAGEGTSVNTAVFKR